MKRIISILLLTAALVSMLAGCGLALPAPEIKNGEFDVTVTYEVNGEVKTLDLVYVCKYGGVGYTLEGEVYRSWSGHFKGYDEGDVIDVIDTEDGGKVYLCFHIYAEYFMGEPDYIDNFAPWVAVERLYYDENGDEMIDYDQDEIAENYGVRVIGIEYDEPIQNIFK